MNLPYWPEERLGELMERLGRLSGLQPEDPGTWAGLEVERIAARMGLVAELLELGYADVEAFWGRAAPALVATPQGWLGFLMGGESPRLLAPDLSIRRFPQALLCAEMRRTIEGRTGIQVDRLLERQVLRRHHIAGRQDGEGLRRAVDEAVP